MGGGEGGADKRGVERKKNENPSPCPHPRPCPPLRPLSDDSPLGESKVRRVFISSFRVTRIQPLIFPDRRSGRSRDDPRRGRARIHSTSGEEGKRAKKRLNPSQLGRGWGDRGGGRDSYAATSKYLKNFPMLQICPSVTPGSEGGSSGGGGKEAAK